MLKNFFTLLLVKLTAGFMVPLPVYDPEVQSVS